MDSVLSGTDGSLSLPVLIAVAVVLLTVLIFLFVKLRSRKKSIVLIVGLSDAGKTLIWSRLCTGNFVTTYTSQKENDLNDVKLPNSKETLRFIDIPGADRLRKRLADHWIKTLANQIKSILFVVDSVTFAKQAKDVAEFLYDILCDCPRSVPLLIACNKQDNPLAKTSQAVCSSLEKEFVLLNRSRSAALDMTDETRASSKLLFSKTLSKFSFDDDLKNRVTFCECYALTHEDEEKNEYNLHAVVDFLNSA